MYTHRSLQYCPVTNVSSPHFVSNPSTRLQLVFVCDTTAVGFPVCIVDRHHPDGLYTYKGSDLPEQTRDGRSGENMFRDNKIVNTGYGAKIKEADNTIITGEMAGPKICMRSSFRDSGVAILRPCGLWP